MHSNFRGDQTCQGQEQAFAAAFFLSWQICWGPSTAFPPGSPRCHMYLLPNWRAEGKVHAPARGNLEEAVSCLGLLGGPSVVTVLGRNYVLLEAWETGRAGSISSNLNVNQLGELTHSHFLARTSVPGHLLSCCLSLHSLSPQGPKWHWPSLRTWVEYTVILQSFPNLALIKQCFCMGICLPLLYDHSESLPRS